MFRLRDANFSILLIDAITYAIALTFLDINTVIPAFLDNLGSPSWQIGFAASLKQIGFLLPQFFLLTIIPKLKNQSRFVWIVYLLDRPQMLVFTAILFLFPQMQYLSTLFLISFGIFCFGEGIVQLPWMNLLGRTVKEEQRGRLWGFTQVAGGIGSVLGGFIIAKMLNEGTISFPHNYIVIFISGIVFLLPSLFIFRMVKNPEPLEKIHHVSLPVAISTAWQNTHFRLMLLVQVLISTDMLTLPFYIVTVKHHFPFLEAQIGTFVYLGIIGGILGGFMWGYLSDRKGNRLTIIYIVLANIAVASSFLATQFISNAVILTFILWPAFILVGMVGGGWLGFVNYMMEIANDQNRLFFITLNNVCMLSVVFLPILGGVLRDYYSDMVIFSVVVAFMLLALYPALKLSEPRNLDI